MAKRDVERVARDLALRHEIRRIIELARSTVDGRDVEHLYDDLIVLLEDAHELARELELEEDY